MVLSDEEKEVLINAFVCAFTCQIFNRVSTELSNKGVKVYEIRNELQHAIAEEGRLLFRPLTENDIIFSLIGPDRLAFPADFHIRFNRDNRNVYMHHYGTLSADPKAPSSFGWLPFEQFVEEKVTTLFGDTPANTQIVGNTRKEQRGSGLEDIFNIVDKHKGTTQAYAYDFMRYRLVDLENALGDFSPIRAIYSYYVKRGLNVDANYLVGPYDVIRDIFVNSVFISSDVSIGSMGLQTETKMASLEPSLDQNALGNDLGRTLFNLKNSKSAYHRQKFRNIQQIFHDLLGNTEFEVYSETKIVGGTSKGEIVLTRSELNINPFERGNELTPLNLAIRNSQEINTIYSIEVGDSDFKIPIALSSHGVSQILTLSTALAMSEENFVILDEPELGLHPTLQKKLIQLLYERASLRSQFILITHSPFCLGLTE